MEETKKDFVHLHVHTEYSLLDGIARIEKLVKVTKERGYSAVAITDHGNMYGALSFYETCVKAGIKPILGCEFYICHDLHKREGKGDIGHLILLAKNNKGYQNLMKLNEIAFCDGFYYKPRIDYEALAAHSEGVICLSACIAGHIPQLIIQHRFDEAEELALKMKNMFAPGDFYFELQNHGLPEQQLVNQKLYEFSKKMGVKVVATNDAHYINREDAEMQDVLMCVQMGKFLDDEDRMKFSTDEFYLKTYEEMKEAMAGYEEALETTLEIADKCDVLIKTKSLGEIESVDRKYELPQNQNHIPKYVTSTGEEPYEFLRRISYEGLKKNYKVVTQELTDRLEMELETIRSQGFVEYFLIVWDYINYAREHGIPVGPGRGSGAGSLVAYTSGITRVDPMKYALFFERFINKERVSMPDFDVDFDPEGRADVIEYVKRRYGVDHVAGIITFGCMQAKNAIRDVGRVMRVPLTDVMHITKLVPSKLPDGLAAKSPVLEFYFGLTGKPENEKYIVPELREIYDSDESIKRMIDIAVKLEGVPRNISQHACGVLIAPESVANFVPVAKAENERLTQYPAIELEHLGLLKMDFLGLINLTVIRKTLKYVKEIHGIDIDFYDMEYDDPAVFEMIAAGKTDAVFQLESGGMKKFMRELKPTSLEDIIAGISLYRPGPMDSIPEFIKNKQAPEHIVYDDPCLEDILDVTYGCIVYQEQVMKIVQVMGGYSLGQADNIRRIMGKKQVNKIAQEREKFINGGKDSKGNPIPGAVALGHDRDVAEKVFNKMQSFAKYAFNKSHAAAYAYVAYQTGYLKCHYLTEFVTAVLNSSISNAENIQKYVTLARSENIEVLAPDINKSVTEFCVEDGKIRFGLGGLKHLGTALTDSFVAEREKNGQFKSFEDFITRAVQVGGINKRAIECLIYSGAFDCFGKLRSQYIAVYDNLVSRATKDKKSSSFGQISFFADNALEDKVEYPNIKEFNKKTLLKNEHEVLGVYLSGHPLQDYVKKFDDYNLTSDMVAIEVSLDNMDEDMEEETVDNSLLTDGQSFVAGGIIVEVNRKRAKNGKDMAYLKVEDLKGTMEMTLFSNAYTKYRSILEEDNMVTIRGKVQLRDGEKPSLIVDHLSLWRDEEERAAKNASKETLYLKFDTKDPDVYCKVKKTIAAYPGMTKVVMRCTTSGKAFSYQNTANVNNYLLNELAGIIGSENVVFR